MAEYVTKEQVIDWFRPYGHMDDPIPFETMVSDLRDMPAADVALVRHGRWIDAYPDIEPNPMFMYGICSECGFEQGISKYLNYCPNCGCRMDG